MATPRGGNSELSKHAELDVGCACLGREHKHAYDCAEERMPTRPTRKDYERLELNADNSARMNYRDLFGTWAPQHPLYNHAMHGNPDCI